MANEPDVSRDIFDPNKRYFGGAEFQDTTLYDWSINLNTDELRWWALQGLYASIGSGRAITPLGNSFQAQELGTPDDNFDITGGWAIVKGRLVLHEAADFLYYEESLDADNYMLKGAVTTITEIVPLTTYRITDEEQFLRTGHQLVGCYIYFDGLGSFEITTQSGQQITVSGDLSSVNPLDEFIILPPPVAASGTDTPFHLLTWFEDISAEEVAVGGVSDLADPVSQEVPASRKQLRWCVRSGYTPVAAGAFPDYTDPGLDSFIAMEIFTIDLNNVTVNNSDIEDGDAYFYTSDTAYSNIVDVVDDVDAQLNRESASGSGLMFAPFWGNAPTFTNDRGSTITINAGFIHAPSLTAEHYRVQSISFGEGGTGSGYTVDDILTIPGGTGIAGTIRATAVDGVGVIISASIEFEGFWSVAPSPLEGIAVTGGTGSGALFDIEVEESPDYRAPLIDDTYLSVGAGVQDYFFLDVSSSGLLEGEENDSLSHADGPTALSIDSDHIIYSYVTEGSANVARDFHMLSIPVVQGMGWAVYDDGSNRVLSVQPGQIHLEGKVYQFPESSGLADAEDTLVHIGGVVPTDAWSYYYTTLDFGVPGLSVFDTTPPSWNGRHPELDNRFCLGMVYFDGSQEAVQCVCINRTIFFRPDTADNLGLFIDFGTGTFAEKSWAIQPPQAISSMEIMVGLVNPPAVTDVFEVRLKTIIEADSLFPMTIRRDMQFWDTSTRTLSLPALGTDYTIEGVDAGSGAGIASIHFHSITFDPTYTPDQFGWNP